MDQFEQSFTYTSTFSDDHFDRKHSESSASDKEEHSDPDIVMHNKEETINQQAMVVEQVAEPSQNDNPKEADLSKETPPDVALTRNRSDDSEINEDKHIAENLEQSFASSDVNEPFDHHEEIDKHSELLLIAKEVIEKLEHQEEPTQEEKHSYLENIIDENVEAFKHHKSESSDQHEDVESHSESSKHTDEPFQRKNLHRIMRTSLISHLSHR